MPPLLPGPPLMLLGVLERRDRKRDCIADPGLGPIC
jgi:hypothetical protein